MPLRGCKQLRCRSCMQPDTNGSFPETLNFWIMIQTYIIQLLASRGKSLYFPKTSPNILFCWLKVKVGKQGNPLREGTFHPLVCPHNLVHSEPLSLKFKTHKSMQLRTTAYQSISITTHHQSTGQRETTFKSADCAVLGFLLPISCKSWAYLRWSPELPSKQHETLLTLDFLQTGSPPSVSEPLQRPQCRFYREADFRLCKWRLEMILRVFQGVAHNLGWLRVLPMPLKS